tara:strand:- start:506 stop:676 length:171 start_codon:yes stop_codon:yes gene_type:complete
MTRSFLGNYLMLRLLSETKLDLLILSALLVWAAGCTLVIPNNFENISEESAKCGGS